MFSGSTFDLRKLTLPSNAKDTYTIKDGDIPCTPEIEPTYSYIWNFCSTIPSSQVPAVCSTKNKTGVVLQYLLRNDGYKECHVIGKYDPAKDDSSFSLLDSSDPSKGVSLTYAQGDRCETNSLTNYRMATLDVECANTKMQIVSAQEPSTCDYHLVMKSYYGCPTVRASLP